MTQPQPQPYGPPTQLGQPTPPKKKSKLPWILGGVALVLLLCFGGCGAILASGGDTTKKPTAETTTTPTTAPATTAAPAVAPATTAPTKPAAPPKPPTPTIEDGVWVVGEDVPAGTYKAGNVVGGDCYWEISKSSSSDIIDNDIPGGGRPKVILKKGQDFTTHDCGTWVKVG